MNQHSLLGELLNGEEAGEEIAAAAAAAASVAAPSVPVLAEEPSKYTKLIMECDENMHQQHFRRVCDALREAKLELEAEENGRVIDNDFNARAGLCALQLGLAEDALKLTEMVNVNNPGTLLIHTLRGWSLREIGYEKRANVLFNYVLNQVSETNSVMDSMGAAISSQLMGSELSLFFYDQAITQFEALDDQEKKLDLIWVIHALTKKNDMCSEVKDKRECLLKALSLTQTNLDVLISLAELFFKQGMFGLAMRCYLRSIEVNPLNHYFRHIKVGFILFYLGEEKLSQKFLGLYYDESEDVRSYFWVMSFASAILGDDDLSEFEKFFKIGVLLYHLQFLQSCLLMLQRAKVFQPKSYKLCVFIFQVHKHLRQFAEAIAVIEELLQMKEFSNDVQLVTILADLYYQTGNAVSAESCHLRAIKISPQSSTDSIYKYVKFLNKENRLAHSLEWINQAIAREPQKVKLLIMKALIYSSLKDLPAAYSTYEEVLAINPSLQSSKFQLSQINYVLKKYSLAFDQMASIKEGQVGFEKSLNLLVKLFISQPKELTEKQLEFANIGLRQQVTEHLKKLGEPARNEPEKNEEEGGEEEKTLMKEEFEVYKQLGETEGESMCEELDELGLTRAAGEHNEETMDDRLQNTRKKEAQTFNQAVREGKTDMASVFEDFKRFRSNKETLVKVILRDIKKYQERRLVGSNDITNLLLKKKLKQLDATPQPLRLQLSQIVIAGTKTPSSSVAPLIGKAKKSISKKSKHQQQTHHQQQQRRSSTKDLLMQELESEECGEGKDVDRRRQTIRTRSSVSNVSTAFSGASLHTKQQQQQHQHHQSRKKDSGSKQKTSSGVQEKRKAATRNNKREIKQANRAVTRSQSANQSSTNVGTSNSSLSELNQKRIRTTILTVRMQTRSSQGGRVSEEDKEEEEEKENGRIKQLGYNKEQESKKKRVSVQKGQTKEKINPKASKTKLIQKQQQKKQKKQKYGKSKNIEKNSGSGSGLLNNNKIHHLRAITKSLTSKSPNPNR